jgi:hypothetical protein
MGLYEKIYNIMNESAGLEKNLQVGTGQNSYKAVGEAEVLNMLKPLFKKHKLIVFPVDGDITEQNTTYDSTYKDETTTKTRNVTQIRVKFKIVDIESKESEILIGFGNGADSQDKGSGKAFTYAYKTMLSKTFMLFSGEDTDNEHSDDIDRKQQNKKLEDKPKFTRTTTTGEVPKGDKASGDKATLEEAKKLFEFAKDKYPDMQVFFERLKAMKEEGLISSPYSYNKKTEVVYWTKEDIAAVEKELALPF